MEVVLLIARLVLAAVFGVAGIAKAADRRGSRRAFVEFGVPESLASPLAFGLPLAEILIAVALIPLSTAWWGAAASLAILMIFAAGIGVKVARGQSPDCRCFGQLHSEPLSWYTLARNLALAAAAGFIVAQGKTNVGLSALSWLSDLRAAEVINLILGLSLIGLLAFASVILNRILKHQAKLFDGMGALSATLRDDGEPLPILRKAATPPKEGLPIGALAPKFALTAVTGEEVSLDSLLSEGKFVLLLFAGPSCWGCKVLLPAVRIWEQDYSKLLTIAVLSTGSLEETRSKMAKFEINHLLLDEDSKVTDEYQAKWTPASVLIGPDGKIASHLRFSDSAIREWLRNLIASGRIESGSNGKGTNGHMPQVPLSYAVRRIGELVPTFWLKDLSGKPVDIEDLRGSPTLLLFWHPLCEICKTMFDDIKAWELNSPNDAPKLVFIAGGELEDIRTVNKQFASKSLLDPAFDVGPLFGTQFTPSAILIDSEGKIASSLAVGAENVRALIGLPKAELPAELQS